MQTDTVQPNQFSSVQSLPEAQDTAQHTLVHTSRDQAIAAFLAGRAPTQPTEHITRPSLRQSNRAPRSTKPPVKFPFTDAYVRALPRRLPHQQPHRSDPLSADQQQVVLSYYAFSLHEGRETWRRILHRSATSTFAARRYIGDLQDADLAATEALVECCRRWPLPCPACAGIGKLFEALRGRTWACPECLGSGKPRNDFTAFHAYLRQAVNQKVVEEVNKRVRDAKSLLDLEGEQSGGFSRRNGKRVREGSVGDVQLQVASAAVGHVWQQLNAPSEHVRQRHANSGTRQHAPVYHATPELALPAILRTLHKLDAQDYPVPTALWSSSLPCPQALAKHFTDSHPPITWPTAALATLRAQGLVIIAPLTVLGQAQVEALASVVLSCLDDD